MSVSRYYRLAPIGETLTRVELVQRLRLLWQGLYRPCPETARALAFIVDALGLAAEREEIFGSAFSIPSSEEKNL